MRSKMSNGSGKVGLASISVAVLLLTIAVATVVGWTENDWFLFIPVLLLGLGGYILVVGWSDRGPSADRYRYAHGSFMMFWGSLLALVGLLLLVDHYYPGNGIWLFVTILVWLAISALLFTTRKR